MFGRRSAQRSGLPDAWRTILDARSAQWRLLDTAERERLGGLADWLLRERRWEAARGFALNDEIRTVVAAHASLLVLELGERWYDEVGAVVVRSGSMDRDGVSSSSVRGVVSRYPGSIDGETHHGDGPLMVAWNAARREALQLRLGRDVVLHEFAHKLDMLDGTLDGTPSPAFDDQPAGSDRLARWVRVCTNHFEAVREGTGAAILREYAGTNAAEFFAVSTETFFTRPIELAAQTPDLYEILRDFYRQDPGARQRRAFEARAAVLPSAPRIIVRPRPSGSR